MNIYIRRFLDPNVSAEPATQVQQPQSSIAELMGRHGVMNNTADPVATPISIPEKEEKPETAQENGTAATANEAPQAEQAKPEAPLPSTVEEPKPTPQIAEAPKPQPTWQEVLKSQQPDAVLKALGYDDKVVNLVNQLKEFDPKVVGLLQAYKEGKHTDYLKELTTDYSNMPAEEVMRHQLRREYPKASEAAIQALFRKEIVSAYNLDSDDEAELAEGKLLLEAKAERYRDEFVKNQESFLLPKPPEPKPVEVDNTAQLVQQEIDSQRSHVLNSPYFKNIQANKKIQFGSGDEAFNYPIEDPNEIVDLIYNSEKFMDAIFEKKENSYIPRTENQILVGLVSKYGMSFLDAYAQHYKSLGGKAVNDLIENAKPPANNSAASASSPEPTTAAGLMAKSGVLNPGGYQ